MSKDRIIGTVFEDAAEKILKENGYKILETNFVFDKYEIDIIAKKGDEISFVEVKSRNGGNQFSPETAVDFKKMSHIFYCAAGYLKNLSKTGIDIKKFRYSFDVVGILYSDDYDLQSVKYFKNYYIGDRNELLRSAL